MKKVTVTFLYDEVKDKDDQYYRTLAFEEIYNGNDNMVDTSFKVEDIGE